MENLNIETKKVNKVLRVYQCPSIETIKLDNEISLLLDSGLPAVQEREISLIVPENLNNNPYKMA